MTRTQRVLRRFVPWRELYADECERTARMRAALAERDATIGALRVELAVEHARWALAVAQRDRARDLVGALLGEARAFTPNDLAFLDDAGVEASE